MTMTPTAPEHANLPELESLSATNNVPITVVVSLIVKAGCEAAYEQWLHDIGAVAMKFPGHLGLSIIRPGGAGQPEYVCIFKFDSYGNLKRWIDSDVRKEWLAKAAPLSQSASKVQVLTGMETWFSLPGKSMPAPPPRYKTMLMTFAVIFPLINLLTYTMGPLLHPLPPPLRSLIMVATMMGLMTYVIMPRVTRLFSKWLYPVKPSNAREPAAIGES